MRKGIPVSARLPMIRDVVVKGIALNSPPIFRISCSSFRLWMMDRSFLGLMVFLIYLGGMLVVFGYTTAMATEQYPEVWVSNTTVMGVFLLGLLMEVVLVLYVLKSEEVGVVFKFSGIGD